MDDAQTVVDSRGNSHPASGDEAEWDHSSSEEFFDYYAAQSVSEESMQRFLAIRRSVLRMLGPAEQGRTLDVADVGCGAGTQCQLWAELGHRVHGLDVNGPLIELGRRRAKEAGADIEFTVGSATELPWPDASMDVCLVPELLEHVSEWEACLDEFSRILRPGGALYLSTTNKLCPIQQEFELPLYSWYPAPLKRHFERLSVTTRPELVNHAKYPAVNWFSFYSLRQELRRRGVTRCADRFDVIDLEGKGTIPRLIVRFIKGSPLTRWLGHVATPSTTLIAFKGI